MFSDSTKVMELFDSGSDLDRCGRLEHCANSGLACKASFILDAANSNRPSIQTYRWDMVKRQPGIHQRHSDCGAFYPQDPVLVRSNRNRRQHGARRRGIGAMPGSMSALPEPSSQEFSPLIFHWEHVSLEQEGWLRHQENAASDRSWRRRDG